MLFPTHLLAAALLSRVSRLSPLWLVAGAALPDLVDKPLAMAGLFEIYHTVAHSALFLVVILPIALTGQAGRAVAVGWASHLCLDAVHVVINGRPGDAVFLAWPLLTPADPLALPPGAFFGYYLWSPSFFMELLLWGTAIGFLLRERGSGLSQP